MCFNNTTESMDLETARIMLHVMIEQEYMRQSNIIFDKAKNRGQMANIGADI